MSLDLDHSVSVLSYKALKYFWMVNMSITLHDPLTQRKFYLTNKHS